MSQGHAIIVHDATRSEAAVSHPESTPQLVAGRDFTVDEENAYYEALARLDATEREDPLLAHTYGCVEDFRGSAIELAEAMKSLQSKGYSPSVVAEHCDLPRSTVRKWMQTARVHRVPSGTYSDG